MILNGIYEHFRKVKLVVKAVHRIMLRNTFFMKIFNAFVDFIFNHRFEDIQEL